MESGPDILEGDLSATALRVPPALDQRLQGRHGVGRPATPAVHGPCCHGEGATGWAAGVFTRMRASTWQCLTLAAMLEGGDV